MWDLPGPEREHVFPALAGKFSTAGPPGKSCKVKTSKQEGFLVSLRCAEEDFCERKAGTRSRGNWFRAFSAPELLSAELSKPMVLTKAIQAPGQSPGLW